MDNVEELVEWVARVIDNAVIADMVDGRIGTKIYAKQILSHSDLALINPGCSTTLRWSRQDKSMADMPCDYWDCAKGIKKGEHYFWEDYGEGQGHTWCIDCASVFMAQKLSYIIPLAEALKEKSK